MKTSVSDRKSKKKLLRTKLKKNTSQKKDVHPVISSPESEDAIHDRERLEALAAEPPLEVALHEPSQ